MSTQRNCLRVYDIDQLRRKNQSLIQQLQIKAQTIDDLSFELRNIKKQQSIWQHLGKAEHKNDQQKQSQRINEQNHRLLNQVSSMIAQNQFKDMTISQLKQKISDLKYHNQQLKKLSKKSQAIYQRQVQMLKSNPPMASKSDSFIHQMSKHRQQKQKLEQKMRKCAQIVKQTEQFYLHQVNELNTQMEQQKKVIIRLEDELYHRDKKIEQLKRQNNDQYYNYRQNYGQFQRQQRDKHKDKTVVKLSIGSINNNNDVLKYKDQLLQFSNISDINCSRWRQSDIEQLVDRQNSQKKWQLAVNQMRQRYQRQINQLKDGIKFLMLKLDGVQDRNNSQNNIMGNSLAHSKIMMMSASSSGDSFRFTPNNSFSSAIKESLTRRESANIKTPLKNKSSRFSGSHAGYLLDKTNI